MKHKNRLKRIERHLRVNSALLYVAVADASEITPDMRGLKVYVGVSPKDWDEDHDETQKPT